jgi:Cu/Zn superoxide dismutase
MNRIRTATATAAALAALTVATPSVAVGQPDAATDRAVRATGPTVVHDARFDGVASAVSAVSTASGRTIVTLHLRHLPEDARGTTLGAHVHTGSCGTNPTASGPHYVNPDAPAGTPLHDKEIWLDLDVDAAGNGRVAVRADWVIESGAARSVVVHASPTDHQTGAAGARLFCTDVPFGIAS